MKKTAAITPATVLILALGVSCAKTDVSDSEKADTSKNEAVEIINKDVLSKYCDLFDAYIEISNRYEEANNQEESEQFTLLFP